MKIWAVDKLSGLAHMLEATVIMQACIGDLRYSCSLVLSWPQGRALPQSITERLHNALGRIEILQRKTTSFCVRLGDDIKNNTATDTLLSAEERTRNGQSVPFCEITRSWTLQSMAELQALLMTAKGIGSVAAIAASDIDDCLEENVAFLDNSSLPHSAIEQAPGLDVEFPSRSTFEEAVEDLRARGKRAIELLRYVSRELQNVGAALECPNAG